jgi:hypothetical protein
MASLRVDACGAVSVHPEMMATMAMISASGVCK